MQQIIGSKNIGTAFGQNPFLHQNPAIKHGLFVKLINWCDEQEYRRFFWLGISLIGHIGVVLPLTLLAILFMADNNFVLWILACTANVPVLALNLAGLPPKVTLPTLFIAWAADAIIILASAVIFFAR